jgi:hypothetical protein
MDDQTSKTVAVFDRPFKLPGFDETLPAGEYDIETELASPPDHKDPRASHPGLTRSLSVSLVDLDNARAKDKLSGKDLSQVFLEDMLADPMVQLVMQADGVSEAHLRHLYSGSRTAQTDKDVLDTETGNEPKPLRNRSDIRDAENEGMPRRSRLPSVSE